MEPGEREPQRAATRAACNFAGWEEATGHACLFQTDRWTVAKKKQRIEQKFLFASDIFSATDNTERLSCDKITFNLTQLAILLIKVGFCRDGRTQN